MKWMIASDLHGSARCCREMLEALRREGADRLVLLGDLLYHGPRNDFPEEYDTRAVTALLNGVKDQLLCVRGNCDSEVDQMVLEFPMLAEYAFLAADGLKIFATHGHNYGPGNPPPLEAGDFLLCGHTHLPVCRDSGGFTYLNPGSLSLPKEGTPHSYMILEGGVFTWHDLFTGETFEPLR
ncbi:MAG: phosphodiesterase [Oscillibacter sp.]|jgi:putative phosphoesterase|nr:phosphodiesterase [uncultured Oscillibacter sp.]MCI8813006.1 phosphodiesterase [Oscillibacter sp.]